MYFRGVRELLCRSRDGAGGRRISVRQHRLGVVVRGRGRAGGRRLRRLAGRGRRAAGRRRARAAHRARPAPRRRRRPAPLASGRVKTAHAHRRQTSTFITE